MKILQSYLTDFREQRAAQVVTEIVLDRHKRQLEGARAGVRAHKYQLSKESSERDDLILRLVSRSPGIAASELHEQFMLGSRAKEWKRVQNGIGHRAFLYVLEGMERRGLVDLDVVSYGRRGRMTIVWPHDASAREREGKNGMQRGVPR